jgi:hypothetical protein
MSKFERAMTIWEASIQKEEEFSRIRRTEIVFGDF